MPIGAGSPKIGRVETVTELVEAYREMLLLLPDPLFGALLFLVAGMVGSFLNVCIWRIPRGQSIVTPRSRCPACGHVLGFADLVPVLSWLAAGGRCRYCKVPIALRYQVVELINIGLWMAAWAAVGRSLALLCAGAVASAVLGAAGVAWMTRKLRREGAGTGAEAPGGTPVAAGSRAGFTFLEVVFAVALLACVMTPFLLSVQTSFKSATKNREVVQAFNLAREKLEELRAVPPEKLKSDFEIYTQGEKNIFGDEFFGPYAKMKASAEAFYEGWSDVLTADRALTESVMEKFKEVFKKYQGFDYQLYPRGYERFRRYTKVTDLTDPKHPNNLLKKLVVTVVIEGPAGGGRSIELVAMVSNR